jgi:micrococcal nuclease
MRTWRQRPLPRRALALLLVWALAAGPWALAAESRDLAVAPTPDFSGPWARVMYVNDGDTVTVRLEGRRELVRILGIDAPETEHSPKLARAAQRAGRGLDEEAALGRQARDRLKELTPPGTTVGLEFDPAVPQRDQYGRLLAYLRLADGRQAGALLVDEGLAQVYRHCGCALLADLSRRESQARARGLGLWATRRP